PRLQDQRDDFEDRGSLKLGNPFGLSRRYRSRFKSVVRCGSMKTVFILGAGASKRAGGPLMADFLDKAESLLLRNEGVNREAFQDVFDARSELQGIYAKSFLDLDN